MNLTHIHLLLNHFPIIGTLIGSLILIAGIISANNILKYTAVWVITFMSILSIPVYLTGENAEETVKHLTGINESLIEIHEEYAIAAFSFQLLAGFAGLLYMWFKKRGTPRPSFMFFIFVFATFFAVGLMAYTGLTGGKIRHTEIRNSIPLQPPTTDD